MQTSCVPDIVLSIFPDITQYPGELETVHILIMQMRKLRHTKD